MSRKQFQCSECSDGLTSFDTEEALLGHKWNVIKSTKRKSHMRCHICKLDHRTFEGLVRHYQINHPAKQTLNCPGCNELFARLHQLMGHLERDACPVIMAERVRQNRMLQVHATNMLAADTDPYSTPVQRIEGIGGSPQMVHNVRKIQGEREKHVDTLQERLEELNVHGRDRADRADKAGGAGGGDNDKVQIERPSFSYSGITLGDFGAFINIKPKVAEAMAVAVAAQNESQARAISQQLLLKDCESAASSQIPPTSAEAIEDMLRRQRQHGRGNAADVKGKAAATGAVQGNDNEKAKAKIKNTASAVSEANAASTQQSTRQFRKGDSKGPDLLTDDTSPLAQRIKNSVWAGQESMGMHEGAETSGAPSRGGAPAFGATTPGIRTRPASAAPSAPGSVAAGTAAGAGKAAAVSTDPNHPSHPLFNVSKYRDQYSGRYSCPHEMCQRSGKQYKSSGALIKHLLSEDAHAICRQQCPSCFGWFNSLNALMQHIESPTTRCHFRETDEYVPFINILSAGVVDVHGHHADMTLAYSVQPTATEALLEDGMLRAQEDDDEVTVW